jgi:hypothetical protein
VRHLTVRRSGEDGYAMSHAAFVVNPTKLGDDEAFRTWPSEEQP